MAIYHFSAQIISRSKGQSAVAAASYRSGEKLIDERTGEIKNYHREVQPETMIIAPDNSPEWVQNRQRLWNEVENVEKRKNSQLAREINIALPIELSKEKQKTLVVEYVKEQFVDKGMIADVCIHRDDSNNPHAHIMLTTREISPEGFTEKNRDWNNRELINDWREQWANSINRSLEKEGVQDKVSHLSNEKRGLDYLPTVHLGHVVNAMEKKGKRTDRGDHNRTVIAYNELKEMITQLEKERTQLQGRFDQELKLENLNQSFTDEERKVIGQASKYLESKVSLSAIDKRLEQLDKWAERVQNNKQFVNWKSETIQQAADIYSSINYDKKQIQIREEALSNIKWINPLKIKENRQQAENLEKQIESLKNDVKSKESKLEYHKTKLKFATPEELQEIKNNFKNEFENADKKNKSDMRIINQEKDVLKNAQNALKTGYIRFIKEKYPDVPEMAYIDFKTAQKIGKINQQYERTLNVGEINKENQRFKDKVERLETVERNIKSSGDPTALKGLKDLQPQIEQLRQVQGLFDSIVAGLQQAQQRQQQDSERKRYESSKKKKKSYSRELER